MKLKVIVGVIAFGVTASVAWKVTANNPIFFGDPFPNLTTAQLESGLSSVAVLNHVSFHRFSDFLLHDRGSLSNGIEQRQASGREMRPAPLWGFRTRKTFLHDGRATTVADAISAHDGQGVKARQKFNALSAKEAIELLAFLSSL